MSTDRKLDRRLDFKGLGEALLSQAGMLLPKWLPGGRVIGREYTCGSLRGEPGESLKVNLDKGKWADFAGDVKGGDLVSLYAAIEGLDQGTAARRCADQIGYSLEPAPRVPAKVVIPPIGAPSPSFQHYRHGKPTGVWTYRTAAGNPMFHVARYDPDGGARKEFLPWCWTTEGKWGLKGFPEPRPIYNLHELAADVVKPVLLVEGEKAAEAARKIAGNVYVVTTWPNGSKAVDKTDWTPLHGRKVLIWPDADAPGRQAAARVAELLVRECPEVKVLDVEGDDGSDAADFKGGWAEFAEWARPRARVVAVPSEPVPSKPAAPVEQAVVEHAREPEIIEAPGGPDIEDRRDVPPVTVNALQVNVNVGEQDVVEGSVENTWQKLGIAQTKNGQAIANVDAALRVLEGLPDFNNLLWFDDFHKRYFTRWKVGEGKPPREWCDVDELNLTTFMQRSLQLSRISDDMVHKAAVVYAHGRVKNEPRDWLAGLTWDGKPRIERFFVDCMGSKESEYSLAASRNFWIGMAARILSPGCQLDNMIVLEGGQGIGKTTALRIIGGPWYTSAKDSVMEKDFFMVLHGKLIVEIAELSSFGRAERNRIKQVVSDPTDRYRAPYARSAQDHPRMSVFVGTTNESNYLADETGARRFWPIRCGEVNRDKIAADREQLFAEAAAKFRAWQDSRQDADGWWLMPEATAAEQEERRQVDEWEPAIASYLVGRRESTTRELAEFLKIEIAKLDMMTQHRIGKVMRALRWDKKSVSGVKVWLAPTTKDDEPF